MWMLRVTECQSESGGCTSFYSNQLRVDQRGPGHLEAEVESTDRVALVASCILEKARGVPTNK